MKPIEIITIIGIAVSSFVGIAGGIMGIIGVNESRKSTRISEKATEIAQNAFNVANRPYLGVGDLQATPGNDGSLDFTLPVKNWGTVPAVDVKLTLKAKFDGNQL